MSTGYHRPQKRKTRRGTQSTHKPIFKNSSWFHEKKPNLPFPKFKRLPNVLPLHKEHKPDRCYRYFHIPGANERRSFLCVCMSMVREQLSPSWWVHLIIQGVHEVCVGHRRGFLYLWQVAMQTIWSASEETDQAPDYTLEDKCQSEKEEPFVSCTVYGNESRLVCFVSLSWSRLGYGGGNRTATRIARMKIFCFWRRRSALTRALKTSLSKTPRSVGLVRVLRSFSFLFFSLFSILSDSSWQPFPLAQWVKGKLEGATRDQDQTLPRFLFLLIAP